jgi:NDP-sugar pyrophosphorylase family protein
MFENNPTEYFLNTELIVHAGGIGERWWPVTKGKIPKPITEIGKKPRPILDWVILPYVAMGLKRVYITLWNNPEAVIEHCKEIEKNSDVKFTFLIEPPDKRLGRAGAVKYYLEEKVLDEKKPKLSVNCSDFIKLNPIELAKFQTIGLKKGYVGTIVGSPVDISQFGRFVCDPDTKIVKSFQEKPVIVLPKGEYVNTGTFYLDGSRSYEFYSIKDSELPMDWERSNFLIKMCKEGVIRCLEGAQPFKTWVWLKTQQDFKKVNAMDLEKFLDVTSVERYLGEYEPNNNNSCS